MSKRTTSERFWSKVNKTDACWLWTAALTNGYGTFGDVTSEGRKMVRAHRWAYEALRGPIPDGLVLDHLCRVRSCVNPDHLEPVTHAVNIARGTGASARNAQKTHCPQGHEYTEENIRIGTKGERRCHACAQQRNALVRTGVGKGGHLAAKTHCPQGHPYAGANLVVEGKARRCRTCRTAQRKLMRSRKSASLERN